MIASLRRRSLLPEAAANGSLSTSDLVALMSEELQTYVMAEVLKLREEFAVYDYDFTLTDGTASYTIPARAIGSKLKDVYLADGDGWVALPRIEPEEGLGITGAGGPSAYYLKGNSVVFVPEPGAEDVRFSYFRRPNKLVEPDDCGLITAINTGTGVVTVSSVPSDFTTSVRYDLVQANPQFETLAMDKTATAVGASSLTFATLPTGLAVGDYVCTAGESPVPQIPVELHPLLAQRTAVKALEALGDSKVSVAKALCDESLRQAQTLLSPRVEERSRFIVNRNAPGWRRRF
jgi:hypothetical protein